MCESFFRWHIMITSVPRRISRSRALSLPPTSQYCSSATSRQPPFPHRTLHSAVFSVYGTSGNRDREVPCACVPTANPPRWSTRQHRHGSRITLLCVRSRRSASRSTRCISPRRSLWARGREAHALLSSTCSCRLDQRTFSSTSGDACLRQEAQRSSWMTAC